MIDFSHIHSSWKPFFTEKREILEPILETVRKEPHNPADALLFRFAQTDLSCVRVVVLGQDPYPQPGAATGRSFEVAGLTSWQGAIRQTSLRNLVRAIYQAYAGELLPWRDVQARIADGRFPLLPPDRLWDKRLWEPFTRALIAYLDAQRGRDAAWFLWGTDARRLGADVVLGRHYESRHPMMADSRPGGFFQNPCFSETWDEIDWTGMKTQQNR